MKRLDQGLGRARIEAAEKCTLGGVEEGGRGNSSLRRGSRRLQSGGWKAGVLQGRGIRSLELR